MAAVFQKRKHCGTEKYQAAYPAYAAALLEVFAGKAGAVKRIENG